MRNKYLKVLIHKANIEKVQCDPYNIDVYCSNEVRSYDELWATCKNYTIDPWKDILMSVLSLSSLNN